MVCCLVHDKWSKTIDDWSNKIEPKSKHIMYYILYSWTQKLTKHTAAFTFVPVAFCFIRDIMLFKWHLAVVNWIFLIPSLFFLLPCYLYHLAMSSFDFWSWKHNYQFSRKFACVCFWSWNWLYPLTEYFVMDNWILVSRRSSRAKQFIFFYCMFIYFFDWSKLFRDCSVNSQQIHLRSEICFFYCEWLPKRSHFLLSFSTFFLFFLNKRFIPTLFITFLFLTAVLYTKLNRNFCYLFV